MSEEKIKKDKMKKIIIGIAVFAGAVFIFGAGIFMGGMKARFSCRWAENYQRNFGGPRGGFIGDWKRFPPPGDFIESRGTFGKIIKINDSDIVVKGKADMEKVILITGDTVIQEGRSTLQKTDLKVGDEAVVIGSPNDAGQIEAKLIRLFGSNLNFR